MLTTAVPFWANDDAVKLAKGGKADMFAPIAPQTVQTKFVFANNTLRGIFSGLLPLVVFARARLSI